MAIQELESIVIPERCYKGAIQEGYYMPKQHSAKGTIRFVIQEGYYKVAIQEGYYKHCNTRRVL